MFGFIQFVVYFICGCDDHYRVLFVCVGVCPSLSVMTQPLLLLVVGSLVV